MLRLFIVSLKRPDHAFEILEYKPDEKYALLRGEEGVYKDINFDLAILKRFYRLTKEVPAWVEKQDAEFPGLRARLIEGVPFEYARAENLQPMRQPSQDESVSGW
jgi:hypothetical protein